MCLILEYLEPKIADKDIVCYKLVKRTKSKDVYKSSFQDFEYIIKKLYTNNIGIEFSNNVIKHAKYCYVIEKDMFHSFISYSHAVINRVPIEFIVRCIIPKGAYYYIGYYNGFISYASSQIKILEEI